MRLKFSPFQKILKKREFNLIYQKGKRLSGKRLVLFYLTNQSFHSKLGLTIGKKWGKAPHRNRFKRVIREAFRKTYDSIPKGLMINIHPKQGYQDLTVHEVETELKYLILICGKTQSEPTKSSDCH